MHKKVKRLLLDPLDKPPQITGVTNGPKATRKWKGAQEYEKRDADRLRYSGGADVRAQVAHHLQSEEISLDFLDTHSYLKHFQVIEV
jgi:hypothetical protein